MRRKQQKIIIEGDAELKRNYQEEEEQDNG